MPTPDLKENERIDDLQRDGCRIIQRPDLFCFGMDAVLLSSFAKCGQNVLDLCSGNGVVPILMDARLAPEKRTVLFTGVEINPVSADMARRSALMNGQQERIHFVEGDIRTLFDAASGGTVVPAFYDTVTVNPPYMTGGGGLTGESYERTIARHEILCTIDDVAKASSMALRSKGHLFMVHRPHRLMDISRALTKYGLEIKRMRMVYPFADKEANMVLIDAVKDGGSYLHVEKPLVIYREKGVYTEEVKELYG